MCYLMTSCSLSLSSNKPLFFRNPYNFRFSANPSFIRPRKPNPFSVSASIAEKRSSIEFSWISSNKAGPDEFNGWAIPEIGPKPAKEKRKAYIFELFPQNFWVYGVGASVASLLGLAVYFTFSSKGFHLSLRSPFQAADNFSAPSIISEKESERVSSDADISSGDIEVPEEKLDGVSEVFETADVSSKVAEERKERITVPLVADSTQQEALLALKQLKIIEEDAQSDELCTRREYARWLVLGNSQLERSRKHRIISLAALAGSRNIAFDDVGVDDPDFEYIQSLAEAGIVRSKLSNGNSSPNLNNEEGLVNFYPERFISRQDLVSWKAKIEYDVTPRFNEEISRKNIGFLDVKEISADVLVALFVDILADEKSILRGVFGQSKRLQPSKPCTKAQAAVALTSGRMKKFVQAEISRLEAESAAKQIEWKEIMAELLERGEVKKYWERKMGKEKSRGSLAETDYQIAIAALEEEMTFQENALSEFLKQKAALDCQKQLLSSLKAEVADMSEKLNIERAENDNEQHGIENVRHDLELACERSLDTKSILEAEVEALRILRSWVEDEARKSQARAKVLEEAGRRWKWDG